MTAYRLEQKYREIFQVKIHEEKLSQLLQSFTIKIHNLQESHKSMKQNISMNNILDEVRKYVKGVIKEESMQTIYKFYEKIQSCNKDISRIEYCYRQFETNMRQEFERLSEKQKVLQKTVAYINGNQLATLQTEIDNIRKEVSQNKSQLVDKVQSNKDKINQLYDKASSMEQTLEGGQDKLDHLQEVVNKLNKKIVEIKPMQANVHKGDIERDKNNLLIKKSRTTNRKTIHKSFDQFKEKDRNLVEEQKEKKGEDLTANKKGESFQSKPQPVQYIQNQIQSLISTQQFAKISKFSSNNNIDKVITKPSLNNKSSNYKRGSIRTEENRQPDYVVDESCKLKANQNSNQIRKIHERLISIQSKYCILQQNYCSVVNRMNKLGNLQATIQGKIEQAQKIRVDTNTINEIKLRFKQIQTSMELEQLRYVNHSTYQKQTDATNRRIGQIQGKLPKFAKKEQVIAAFNFVENKIKEIILVLSDKFEEDKLGAINKIQNIRCLTCDRQNNLTDVINISRKGNRNVSLKNRFSLDRHEVEKRMKSEQNQ